MTCLNCFFYSHATSASPLFQSGEFSNDWESRKASPGRKLLLSVKELARRAPG
ncbi:hypothetical protein B7P43_G08596 [Cryptotermes secundus]|uniref:Uncharacterized protein n=1 Tax=Cryptotermes secundus TaxID=105785 RepID=A0A2J7QZ43_9NEOP|nr:hypothetical protein B7P43_G08596 [Cryptotermes secundus]